MISKAYLGEKMTRVKGTMQSITQYTSGQLTSTWSILFAVRELIDMLETCDDGPNSDEVYTGNITMIRTVYNMCEEGVKRVDKLSREFSDKEVRNDCRWIKENLQAIQKELKPAIDNAIEKTEGFDPSDACDDEGGATDIDSPYDPHNTHDQ